MSFVTITHYVHAVALTQDGKKIVSDSRDYTIRLWDIETGECVRTFRGHRDVVSALAITPDGRNIISNVSPNDDALANDPFVGIPCHIIRSEEAQRKHAVALYEFK